MPITQAADLVAAAKAEITVLSLDETRAAIDDGALLIDIRDGAELAARGRIEGAVHVPRGMLEFAADPQSPFHDPAFSSGRRLVVFCAGAARSALAVKTLQDMGMSDVVEMDEGFEGWATRGWPVAD